MTSTESDELKLLLHESAQARDDDRYLFVQFTTLGTVALSLIVAMVWLFSQTCPAGYGDCADIKKPTPISIQYYACQPGDPGHDGAGTKLTPIPIWIYFFGPLLPLALVAYAVLISSISTLRAWQRINTQAGAKSNKTGGLARSDNLPCYALSVKER